MFLNKYKFSTLPCSCLLGDYLYLLLKVTSIRSEIDVLPTVTTIESSGMIDIYSATTSQLQQLQEMRRKIDQISHILRLPCFHDWIESLITIC